jgi:methylthioribose-1-phosphate isomerase
MQINDKIPLIFGVPDVSFYETLKEKKVFVAELRPALEGMNVVAPVLLKNKITPVLICDNMLGFCMKQGLVSKVFIFTPLEKAAVLKRGLLPLEADGDSKPPSVHTVRELRSLTGFTHAVSRDSVLCRTGSLIAALLAQEHKIPVYLFKAKTLSVSRQASLLKIGNKKVTVSSIKTYVPLFEEVPEILIASNEVTTYRVKRM